MIPEVRFWYLDYLNCHQNSSWNFSSISCFLLEKLVSCITLTCHFYVIVFVELQEVDEVSKQAFRAPIDDTQVLSTLQLFEVNHSCNRLCL